MKNRCLYAQHSSYYNYGAKGISIDSNWLGINGFVNFLKDLGFRPENTSLDRINNSEGYSKINCKWSSYREQALNRKKGVERVVHI